MDNFLNRRYKVGEKRLIEWQVKPNSPDDIIVVTDAKYELMKDGIKIENGDASRDGLTVSHFFQAAQTGSFMLRLYVTVPPETIVTELYIEVSE